ncbi:glycosyltransferase [Leucobacter japonicus]|uniref:glycosyltransferase n=1 Tax=Leucobacter japonicus TaxID=1461259 RepID=UPI0006A7C6D8|nr:glycosyltransferase [Leucobacter japonicus]
MAGLIAHEWIEQVGGAEKVLDAFADTFADADMFCLWNDAPQRYSRPVHESFLARTPLRGRKALAMPLMPKVWNSLSNDGYDWLLISSHLFAHQAQVPGLDPNRKFVYTHTPARYLWEPELDARGASPAVRAASPMFRALDARAAREHRNVAANSDFVRARIARTWGVDATVIHPPVDIDRLQRVADWRDELDEFEAEFMATITEPYLLGASRFVPYKQLDTVITAGAATGMPVVIAGNGPDEDRLRAHAASLGAEVRFVISPSDALLAALMQHAAVYIFPAVEDFGIMPVEAMALGTPVIVNAAGGASESMLEGHTGVALSEFTPAALTTAVHWASGMNTEVCRARAREFSTTRFQGEIRSWMSL